MEFWKIVTIVLSAGGAILILLALSTIVGEPCVACGSRMTYVWDKKSMTDNWLAVHYSVWRKCLRCKHKEDLGDHFER